MILIYERQCLLAYIYERECDHHPKCSSFVASAYSSVQARARLKKQRARPDTRRDHVILCPRFNGASGRLTAPSLPPPPLPRLARSFSSPSPDAPMSFSRVKIAARLRPPIPGEQHDNAIRVLRQDREGQSNSAIVVDNPRDPSQTFNYPCVAPNARCTRHS